MDQRSARIPGRYAAEALGAIVAVAGLDAGALARQAAAAAPPERPVTFSLRGSGEAVFNTDLKDSAGDVSVSRVGAELGIGVPIGDRSSLDLRFAYEYTNYDFRHASGIIPGTEDPFQDVHQETLIATFSRQQSERWAWFVGGDAVLAAEDGADLGNALTGGVFGGATYALSESFSLGLGAWFQTSLEDDTFLWPVPILDWKISDRWRLSTEHRPGAVLIYSPSDHWSFRAGGFFEFSDFRLDQTGPLPDGAVIDSRVPLSVGASYTPGESVSVRLDVGAYVYQQYKVFDDSGSEVSKIKSDAAPFLMLTVGYRF